MPCETPRSQAQRIQIRTEDRDCNQRPTVVPSAMRSSGAQRCAASARHAQSHVDDSAAHDHAFHADEGH